MSCSLELSMASGPDVVRHTILCLHCIYRMLGECLLISSLPGKALRTLVDITRLAAFSRPSLVNLISKDANLVFYLSV